MKHISQYITMMALAITWSSCNDSQIAELDNPEKGVSLLQATIAETAPATKTTLSGTSLSWAKNDAIGVLADGGITKYLAQKEGKSVAFGGETVTNPQAAYYPFSTVAGDGIESNTLTLTLPTERTVEEKCTYSPMVAPSYSNGFQFQHLCGLLSFTMENVPAGAKLQITSGNSSQPIAGTFVVSDITAEDAALQLSSVKGETGLTTVTYTYPNTVMKSEAIYLPLPVGAYDKLTFTLTEGETTLLTKSVSSLEIKKGYLVNLNTLNRFVLKPSEVQAVLEKYMNSTAGITTFESNIKIQLIEEEDTDGDEMIVNIPKFAGTTSSKTILEFTIPKSYTKPLLFNELDAEGTRTKSPQIKLYVTGSTGESVQTTWTETPAYTPVSDTRIVKVNAPKNSNLLIITADDATGNKVELKEVVVNNAAATNISSAYLYIDKVQTLSGKTIQVNGIVGTVENLSSTGCGVTIASNGSIRPGYVYNVLGKLSSSGVTSKFSWDGTTACKPLKDETGYLIRSVYELAYFLDNPIDDNVQLKMTKYVLNKKSWKGLVLQESKTFNGNGATVSEFTLDTASSNGGIESSGFFSFADKGSSIQNLTVTSITATKPLSNIGGLVGYCKSASIENCIYKSSTLDCSSKDGVDASSIGGLIGVVDASDNAVFVKGCQAIYNGTSNYLKGLSVIGGMIGKVILASSDVVIEDCVTFQKDANKPIQVDETALTALGDEAKNHVGFNGRLVGTVEGLGALFLENCYNSTKATITSSTYTPLTDFSADLFNTFKCDLLTVTEAETTKKFTSKGTAYIGRIQNPENIAIMVTKPGESSPTAWRTGTDYNVYE